MKPNIRLDTCRKTLGFFCKQDIKNKFFFKKRTANTSRHIFAKFVGQEVINIMALLLQLLSYVVH